jgi:hypothetical protein
MAFTQINGSPLLISNLTPYNPKRTATALYLGTAEMLPTWPWSLSLAIQP